jgi:hypothetical protein
MRHLAAFLLVLALVFMPSCKFFKGKKLFGRKAREMELLKIKQDSIRVADSLKQVQEKLLAMEKARLDSINTAEEQRKAWEIENKYNIIVGSFITPEYARSLAEEYRQKGYNVRILKMEGGRFELVSAEAHSNLNKAIGRLKEFQDNIVTDAWIYIYR